MTRMPDEIKIVDTNVEPITIQVKDKNKSKFEIITNAIVIPILVGVAIGFSGWALQDSLSREETEKTSFINLIEPLETIDVCEAKDTKLIEYLTYNIDDTNKGFVEFFLIRKMYKSGCLYMYPLEVNSDIEKLDLKDNQRELLAKCYYDFATTLYNDGLKDIKQIEKYYLYALIYYKKVSDLKSDYEGIEKKISDVNKSLDNKLTIFSSNQPQIIASQRCEKNSDNQRVTLSYNQSDNQTVIKWKWINNSNDSCKWSISPLPIQNFMPFLEKAFLVIQFKRDYEGKLPKILLLDKNKKESNVVKFNDKPDNIKIPLKKFFEDMAPYSAADPANILELMFDTGYDSVSGDLTITDIKIDSFVATAVTALKPAIV
ncbi:hypothetical protein MBAV_004101, partial [Candidatus Magnetobacterium bavaricum]